jgi:hypothetical protein
MQLPRAHLFEFNDLARTPTALRDTIVETLSRALAWGRMLRGLVTPFREFLAAAGTDEVLDLCAGSAGPARILSTEMARGGAIAPRFFLTDLFPRLEDWQAARAAHPATIEFIAEPVDATQIPPAIADGRVRAVINAFHHFPPALARAILADAVAGSRGIFIAEGFERNPLRFASFAPAALPALALSPILTRRDRLAKALLTWASPVALLAGTWDGLVSTLRVYREDELRAMVAPLGDGFRWVYGTYDYWPGGRGYYFYGVPR